MDLIVSCQIRLVGLSFHESIKFHPQKSWQVEVAGDIYASIWVSNCSKLPEYEKHALGPTEYSCVSHLLPSRVLPPMPSDLAIPPDSSLGLCCPTVSPTPAYRGGLSTLDVGRAPWLKATKKFPGKGAKSPIPTCL